jgi:hypothetical protein
MGFFGQLFIVFITAVVLLGIVGWAVARRNAAKKVASADDQDQVLSEKTVNNVSDLNDRFNRARYMDEDGK